MLTREKHSSRLVVAVLLHSLGALFFAPLNEVEAGNEIQINYIIKSKRKVELAAGG
jgi:hypothetical protein